MPAAGPAAHRCHCASMCRWSVPSTLRVNNNLLRPVASADLQLRGTYDRPLLFGRAEVDRGEVTFEGRRYRVTKGAIEFTNPTRIEPFFDVEAETRVRVPGQTYRVTSWRRARSTGCSRHARVGSAASAARCPRAALQRRPTRRRAWRRRAARARRTRTSSKPDILTTRATQLLASPISSEVGRVVEADLRRGHLPADAVADRSVQPITRRRASIRRRA